jgi:hypothetical protein
MMVTGGQLDRALVLSEDLLMRNSFIDRIDCYRQCAAVPKSRRRLPCPAHLEAQPADDESRVECHR